MSKETTLEEKALPAGPCVMVIFGASGDLAKRKLIPALYNLGLAKMLPENFAIVGLGSRPLSKEEFEEHLSSELCDFVSCEINPKLKNWLVERMHYIQGDFNHPETFQELEKTLKEVDKKYKTGGNYLHYLAIPPSFFLNVVEKLSSAGLTQEENGSWRRIVVEKPFGHDYESARALNLDLQKHLREHQIYRIDHYLGKETVQNILVFRFANGIFEPIWNRNYIDHVQITVSEELGVEHRSKYYEEAGALRDMVANHMLQLLAYVTMEPPNSFDAEAVRTEKAKLLQAIKPITPEEVLSSTVRGQYGHGKSAEGEQLLGYRGEPGVSPESEIETYVALKFLIDNWRWADVPFYIRTGKRMSKRTSEIAIFFKKPPYTLFSHTEVHHLKTNVLVIRIQPNEGISLSFSAKVPGPVLNMGRMKMDFSYCDYFGSKKPAIGYETLLSDCMKGDATLFLRADNVEYAWETLISVMDVWKSMPARDFPNYDAGSWGPEEADKLLEKEGRRWRNV